MAEKTNTSPVHINADKLEYNSEEKPNTPLGFRAWSTGQTSAYFEWNKVDNAKSYEIIRMIADNQNGGYVGYTAGISDSTSLTIDTLQANTHYEFVVRAFNDELAEMLYILFKHTNEALKRIDYENLLKKKAVIDPLTNVYNRLYYNQAIKYEVKLAKRYKNDIGFIVIDINNLKKINDEHGHNMGDKALKFVADLLVSQARETDNVIRRGGDEFLVMLPQTGKEVKIVENRLKKKIVDSNKKSKLPFPVNFAIGSAFWNIELNKSTEEIIKEADNKMYIDKRNYAKSR